MRVTCVLYAAIIVKVDGGFLREFRPNRFIKNNSQLKHSIVISSFLFFFLVWSYSNSEGKQKTVGVIGVDCKIPFSVRVKN